MKNVGRQKGFSHIEIFIVIVVLIAAGGAGWYVWKKNNDKKNSTASTAVKEAVKDAKCNTSDKDICKFIKSTAAQQFTTMNSTTQSEGKTITMIMKTEGDNKTYMKMSGGGMDYEVITIGNATYTKGASTWYKQTTTTDSSSVTDGVTNNVKTTFEEPSTSENASGPTYKKIGTETVDGRKCLKYQIVDPSSPNTTQYVWFDTKDYQLRKIQYDAEGSATTATFGYGKVSINVPSPVQDLAPGQYILPGQSEPVTMPTQ